MGLSLPPSFLTRLVPIDLQAHVDYMEVKNTDKIHSLIGIVDIDID